MGMPSCSICGKEISLGGYSNIIPMCFKCGEQFCRKCEEEHRCPQKTNELTACPVERGVSLRCNLEEVGKMGRGVNDIIIEKLDVLSIDDLLRGLIADSDLEEVVCCLDFIAKESDRKVEMYCRGVREYPAS